MKLEIGMIIIDSRGKMWEVINSFFNEIFEIVELRPKSFQKAKVRYIHSFELITQYTIR